MKNVVLSLAPLVLILPGIAMASKSPSAADKMLDSLIECQLIGDASQKLACFEARVTELKAARERDKSFFSTNTEREKFSPFDGTVTSATEILEGQWLLVLSDGSIWRTTETIRFEPKKGTKIHVGRGALGSYVSNIGDERAVKVRPLR